jgi:hypothetical protein
MMRIPSFRGLGLAAALLVGTSGIALATPSGTTITNTVDLSYETSGVPVTVDDAATTSFVVDTAIDLIVEGMDASNSVTATRNEEDVVLTFRVENLGNDTRGYDIGVGSTGTIGLTYDAAGGGAPGTYFVAYDTVATYNPGTATVYNTAGTIRVMDRAEGEEFYVFIVANIPASVVDDETDTFTVTATTLDAGTNTITVEDTGNGVDNVDVVFADPGEDGFESDASTLVIAAPELTATKTSIVVDENRQGTFNCATGVEDPAAEAYIPGACVEYTITLTNATGASVDADDIVITDVLEANTTYAASDEGTFDSLVLSGGDTLTAELASLAPGASASFTVRVTID